MLSELDELDSSSGWVPFFQKLNWIAKDNANTQKIAKLPENRLLNRYRDVLPYDHSRVVLKEGETDYINANLIEVPSVNRRYILTQGPLKNTMAHFWQMVWEQKTQAIIMLNRVIEKNQIKCHQYWPCGQKVGHTDVLEIGCFRITYIEESMSEFFTVRTLEIFNLKEKETRNVYHFHYLHWPDFGVPTSPATFLSFLFEARNAGVLSSDVGPAVIHCSAGIGRSGTYILVDSILKEVEQTQDLNNVDVKKALLQIRSYRVGLIQTPDQLRFTYAAILEGTRMLMPQVYEEALDKFLNEGEPEEEEVSEEAEVPPPVPARKRQEVDQPVDAEANIAPKRKRSLPDIPTESTPPSAAETPKQTPAAVTPDSSKGKRGRAKRRKDKLKLPKTRISKQSVSSYQGFQEDTVSSDESDGEDEIIDLSASSSSSSPEDEGSEKDGERSVTKEGLTTEQDDQRYTNQSEEEYLGGKSEKEDKRSKQTRISHETGEESIEMKEEEELEAGVEDEDFMKPKPETTRGVEREKAMETTVPQEVIESRMAKSEKIHDEPEDKKESEETAKAGKTKDKQVRKEMEKKIDAGKCKCEDLFDRLEDGETFVKGRPETEFRSQARDRQVMMERGSESETGKPKGVTRRDEMEDLYDRQEDRKMLARGKPETLQDKEVRKEKEKKTDIGKSRGFSEEMEGGMMKPEDVYGRLEYRDEIAGTAGKSAWGNIAKEIEARMGREKTKDTERHGMDRDMQKRKKEIEDQYNRRRRREDLARTDETAMRDKEREPEVWMEKEKAMDAEKSRKSREIKRMEHPGDLYRDRVEDGDKFDREREVSARRAKEREPEARMEKEKAMDAEKSRKSREMERMEHPGDLYRDRVEDGNKFDREREVTAMRDKEREPEVWMEKERAMDAEKSRKSREMERMEHPGDLYRDRVEDGNKFAGAREVTERRGKEREPEVWMEKERAMDAEKSRKSREMERMEHPGDLYRDRVEDGDKFDREREVTAMRDKEREPEVRMEKERAMDAEKSRKSREMERMEHPGDLYRDRVEDGNKFAGAREVTERRGKEREPEVWMEKERAMDAEKSRKSREMERMEHPGDLYRDRLEDGDKFDREREVTAMRDKEREPEVWMEKEKAMDAEKSRKSREMERMEHPGEMYRDRVEDGDKFDREREVTERRGKDKEPEVRMEKEKAMDAEKYRKSRDVERRMRETEDLYGRRGYGQEFPRTEEETLQRGQEREREAKMGGEKELYARRYRMNREMESGIDETEIVTERMKDGKDSLETELRKDTVLFMEAEGEKKQGKEEPKGMAIEIAVQTSIPFMEVDKKVGDGKERTLEEELKRKESIGIQAEDIVLKIDKDIQTLAPLKEEDKVRKENIGIKAEDIIVGIDQDMQTFVPDKKDFGVQAEEIVVKVDQDIQTFVPDKEDFGVQAEEIVVKVDQDIQTFVPDKEDFGVQAEEIVVKVDEDIQTFVPDKEDFGVQAEEIVVKVDQDIQTFVPDKEDFGVQAEEIVVKVDQDIQTFVPDKEDFGVQAEEIVVKVDQDIQTFVPDKEDFGVQAEEIVVKVDQDIQTFVPDKEDFGVQAEEIVVKVDQGIQTFVPDKEDFGVQAEEIVVKVDQDIQTFVPDKEDFGVQAEEIVVKVDQDIQTFVPDKEDFGVQAEEIVVKVDEDIQTFVPDKEDFGVQAEEIVVKVDQDMQTLTPFTEEDKIRKEDFGMQAEEIVAKMDQDVQTSTLFIEDKICKEDFGIQAEEILVKIDQDVQTSTSFIEEDEICKEDIGIQAEEILVKMDQVVDRETESKKIPPGKEEGKQKELIDEENIKRVGEKVISSAAESRISEQRQQVIASLGKREKPVKAEEKFRKSLIVAGKMNLTGPALILEKMNAIRVEEGVVYKPAPEPMESESDIMESGYGAYARVIKAEKTLRPGKEPSNESISGKLGSNPRKPEPEIPSKERKYVQVKAPDETPQPSTSTESATELRRRQRQEKKEKTEKLVKDIKANVKWEENTRWIRKIIRNSLIVIGVCAAAYVAYRCYRYFFRVVPRRKFRKRFF